MFECGFKIGSREKKYASVARKLFDNGLINYLELFAVSNSYHETISFWKEINIPFVIHAPHSVAGLNLSIKENRKDNTGKISEAFMFADALHSSYVIFHLGTNGSLEESIYQLGNFSENRILVENKPKYGVNGELCVGVRKEDIIFAMKSLNCGFVLDFGHAICAANSLKISPLEFIDDFILLNPIMYHLTDGDYLSEKDQHLSYGTGSFPLSELIMRIKSNSKVTNEASKSIENETSIIDDFLFLNKHNVK